MPDKPIDRLEILSPNPFPDLRIRKVPQPPQEAPTEKNWAGMFWKLCCQPSNSATRSLCVGATPQPGPQTPP